MRNQHKFLGAGIVVVAAIAAAGSYFSRAERPDSASAPPTIVDAQANVYTFSLQKTPSVDVDRDGTTLVAWGSRRQEGGTYGIFGRLFDAHGAPIGEELHLNQQLPSAQEEPAVVFAPDGTAWVAWQSYGQDGSGNAIVARRFGRSGERFVALGDEFIVNQRTEGDQTSPTLAAGEAGVLVAWNALVDAREVIAGRIYRPDGVPTDEIALVELPDANASRPSVAAQPGGFVLAWARRAVAGPPTGVYFTRIDAACAPIGGGAIAYRPGRHDIEPSLDTDAQGRFAVAWLSAGTRGGAYEVLARSFEADGAPAGEELRIASPDSARSAWLNGAAVAMADDGRFAVGYNVEEARHSYVMAQRFDADGAPEAPPARVNAAGEGVRRMSLRSTRRMVLDSHGRLAVAWHGKIGDDDKGVGLTVNVPAGTRPSETLVLDRAIVTAARADEMGFGMVPPDRNANWVPQKAETVTLAPGQDFGFIGFTATEWQPPDVDISVGPEHVVVGVNMQIAIFEKDGTQLYLNDLRDADGFFGEVGAQNFVFDPVELYDPFSDRFIFLTLEWFGSQTAYLVLAVSEDSTPTGGDDWHKYRWDLQGIGSSMDFPNVGVGPDAIYVATDFFSPALNYVHVIDKAAVLDGMPTTPISVAMRTDGRLSLGASKSYDADQPAQYFASSFESNSSIAIYAIRNALTAPVVDVINIPVTPFSDPPGAEQMGSGLRVATVDRRIKNGVYRNGSFWFSHTIGDGGVARTRWYEIAMNGWPVAADGAPSVEQEQTVNLGAGVHNWFSDVDVDAQGNMAIAFNRSSSSEFVSIQRTFRLADDPPGTLRAPETQQTSTGPVTSGRYGDYGGIHQDPAAPNVFWNSHEYWTTDWRTWIGRFELPVTNCPEDLDGSGAVDSGDIVAVLAAWGNAGGPEDLDSSGTVDYPDLLAVLVAWGPC